MSRFTWFVFLKNQQSTFSNDLIVPYNCEFVIIQETRESIYKLTEFYLVKNKTFHYNFGIWDHDLTITNFSMYSRRLNVNGTELIYGQVNLGVSIIFIFYNLVKC